MKNTLLKSIKILLTFMTMLNASSPVAAQKIGTPEIDKKVEDLLGRLTIEEKVGQMTQLQTDMIIKGATYAPAVPVEIDQAKLEKAIVKYKVGSILNTPQGILIDQAKWLEIHTAVQAAAQRTPAKIPVLYGIDAIHGANYVAGATLYPQPLGIGNTFNRTLAKELAAVNAYETRSVSLPWNFSPALDIGRNPEWPRLWESFGEDVYVNAELGVATVQGYQGENPAAKDKVAACLKHYTGYGVTWSGKDRTPAYIPERQLREYYLPAFKATIEAGALTLMINSGEINGVPVHASKFLLTDVLREELGFEGLAVTDWEDINYLHTRHKVAATMKDAVRIAVEAGIDMSMVPSDFEFADNLVELVKEGTISEERIDVSVRRILKLKYVLGLFEQAIFDPADYPKFGGEEHCAKSKQGALESIVLLKNEKDILPLPKTVKVLVTGPAANSMRSLNGGWTYTWQGEKTDEIAVDENSILEAVTAKLGKDQVKYVQGADFTELTDAKAAVSAAAQVDYIIACVGESSYTEYPGSLNDLNLPDAQLDLVKALAKTGKPIILVAAEGRPRIIRKIEPAASAVLAAFYPGMEGGNALADIIFGDYNPDGKLCLTYPRWSNALETYDHKFTEEAVESNEGPYYEPQYEFGHGLSYTDFTYSNLKLSKQSLRAGESLSISVEVRNTGKRRGKESVLLYISDLYATITPPVKRLRGFEKIDLEPGAKEVVTFKISTDDLAFVGLDNKWITEPGDFVVRVGDLKGKFVVE